VPIVYPSADGLLPRISWCILLAYLAVFVEGVAGSIHGIDMDQLAVKDQ
jgi:hypothetical protein